MNFHQLKMSFAAEYMKCWMLIDVDCCGHTNLYTWLFTNHFVQVMEVLIKYEVNELKILIKKLNWDSFPTTKKYLTWKSLFSGSVCVGGFNIGVCEPFTLQSVGGGLRQSSTIWLHQWTTDGDQWASSIRQRCLQRCNVIELDWGEAANETFRSCLHYFIVEVLPS